MKMLDLTLPTPAENLACDEVLLNACESGGCDEVLRFWEAAEPFVVVGYANKVATEVNVDACQARGIPILRRCSGGGTVVQGPGCLNFSLVLKIKVNGPLHNVSLANQYIMRRNRAALARCLPKAKVGKWKPEIAIRGHTDLALSDRKFSGNSQRRHKRALLFHGTFLLNFDLALISDLLRMPSKQPDYRESRPHSDFLMNLNLSADVVKRALLTAWNATGPLENFSQERVTELAQSKYATVEWNRKF